MRINGKAVALLKPATLDGYLRQAGWDPAAVAVEVNGRIVPKSDFAKTALADDDVVEILRFVGGG